MTIFKLFGYPPIEDVVELSISMSAKKAGYKKSGDTKYREFPLEHFDKVVE